MKFTVAIVSKAIKMEETVKSNFEALVEQEKETINRDITAGEVFENMYRAYIQSCSMEGMIRVREMQQVRYHASRLEEIFGAICKDRFDREEELKRIIEGLNKELGEVKAALYDARSTLDSINGQHGEALKEKDKEVLYIQDEASKRVAAAEERADRAEADRDQWDGLLKMAQKTASEAETRAEQYAEKVAEVDRYAAETKAAKERTAEIEAQLKETINRMENEKDKAVLEAQRAEMDKQNRLQEELRSWVEKKSEWLDMIRTVEKERDAANLAVLEAQKAQAESEQKAERLLAEQQQLLQRVKDLEAQLTKKK